MFVALHDHKGQFVVGCTKVSSSNDNFLGSSTAHSLRDCCTLCHIECVLAPSYSTLLMGGTIVVGIQNTTFIN